MLKRILFCVAVVAVCFLCGCSMRTVDEMYCLPERPESYTNLQSLINESMVGRAYCAPLTGENQQTVQMADLNGDGIREYLLYAKSNGELPLQILIFSQTDEDYVLTEIVESPGAAFDVVEYVQMDGKGGMELIVGRQLSDGVLRSVSVYTNRNGTMEQVMTTSYAKILPCDLNSDDLSELFVLRPDQAGGTNGIAELYSMETGTMERSKEAPMSGPTDNLKRVITGNLSGGVPGVFVGTSVAESAIITDVYALVDGALTNVSLSNESGTSVQTLRNYYVYADDIDNDGEVELPSLMAMQPMDAGKSFESHHVIRWYSITTDGGEVDKMFTYHNFVGGWYMSLGREWASRISVMQNGNAYDFYLWDTAGKAQCVFTVYSFTGQDREQLAVQGNRFVLHRTESSVYAAHLAVASGELRITQEDLIAGFHLIRLDWRSGEM